MFMAFDRVVVTTAWLVAFGLLGLLWSPPSVAMGVLLLLVGLICPAALLVLWKEQPPPTAVHVVRPRRATHRLISTNAVSPENCHE